MVALGRRALGRAALTALPLVAIRTRPAGAAEFSYKFASNMPPAHPLNVRIAEAAERIRQATDGKLELRLFPNNQLGGDTDMVSQLRSGALEFFTVSGLVLSPLVPQAAISGVGFAFKNYDQVWATMEGKLGEYVRGLLAKKGIIAFEKIYDNGFRQMTTSTKPILSPADLAGLKIRVPVAPLWTSLFKALGASPISINFSEVYSALQTHIADAQENPLVVIHTAKLFEVQKYCSTTNHMWDGFWFTANRRAFEKLPPDVQDIVRRELNRSAKEQQADTAKLNGELRGQLSAAGMEFHDVSPEPFRAQIQQAGFYNDWKARFGEEVWGLLEASVGTLS